MKKVIIGSIVGMVIFFAFQSAMWMGGVNADFTNYSGNQDIILEALSENLTEDGLYSMPYVDPNSPTYQEDHHKLMAESVGKPWAMVFYHSSMKAFEGTSMIYGSLYSLIMCLIVSLIMFNGGFSTFGSRFLVSMGIALFAMIHGPISEMNWWSFPWSFSKTSIFDLTFGWGLVSLWLAWFVKKV